MKILHVLDHSIPLHSGYTFRTRAILGEQRAMGWETTHVTSAKHTEAAGEYRTVEEVDGFRFYRTPLGRGLAARLPITSQWAVVAGLARRLAEVVFEERPDVIHAHSPALNGLAALRVAKQAGLPMIYECRAFWEDAAVDHGTSRENGPRYRLTRSLETSVFRRADGVTTICEGLKNDIVDRGVPAEKVTVIPNAVDIDRFDTGRERNPALARELGLDGATVLGFIGSFYAYEGLALLLEALPKIRERAGAVRLLLVGGGPQDARLRARARELGMEHEVIFTGRVPHEAVERYYDLVDIFVYPRLSMRLTELVTPLKPLEAMAQGRLVVASDVGGHRELIRDGETGLLFRAGDVEDLTATVARLAEDRQSWPALARAGRGFVERERTWRRSVERYALVYGRLVGGVSGDGRSTAAVGGS